MSAYTKGPWYVDADCNIWRRPSSDLYQNGGSVAGDRPIATVHKGWYASNEQGFPVEANARLIAAAPELLEALELAHDHLAIYHESLDGQPDAVLKTIRAAIAKAKGE